MRVGHEMQKKKTPPDDETRHKTCIELLNQGEYYTHMTNLQAATIRKKKIIHALTMNPDKKAAPYSSNRKQREKNLLFMFFK